MSCSDSYITKNPLLALTESGLPPKRPKLEPQICDNETEFIKSHKFTTIFELKYYDHHEHRSLPVSGWIKPCVKCRARTGSTVIYSHPNHIRYMHFRIHICASCKKKYDTTIIAKCKKFTDKHLGTCQYYVTPKLE